MEIAAIDRCDIYGDIERDIARREDSRERERERATSAIMMKSATIWLLSVKIRC